MEVGGDNIADNDDDDDEMHTNRPNTCKRRLLS